MNTDIVKGNMRNDTRAILRVAGGIELTGVICAVLVWLNGGMSSHGPTGNLAWFALVVALGCIPTGTFFLLLGCAKWMGDRNRTD
jgi:hypothetical protein